MNKKYQSIQPLFETYEKASNEATDCLIESVEARKIGKTAIADYLENKMYPKLRKRSCDLYIKFSDALDRL
jgi:hypothetical protein